MSNPDQSLIFSNSTFEDLLSELKNPIPDDSDLSLLNPYPSTDKTQYNDKDLGKPPVNIASTDNSSPLLNSIQLEDDIWIDDIRIDDILIDDNQCPSPFLLPSSSQVVFARSVSNAFSRSADPTVVDDERQSASFLELPESVSNSTTASDSPSGPSSHLTVMEVDGQSDYILSLPEGVVQASTNMSDSASADSTVMEVEKQLAYVSPSPGSGGVGAKKKPGASNSKNSRSVLAEKQKEVRKKQNMRENSVRCFANELEARLSHMEETYVQLLAEANNDNQRLQEELKVAKEKLQLQEKNRLDNAVVEKIRTVLSVDPTASFRFAPNLAECLNSNPGGDLASMLRTEIILSLIEDCDGYADSDKAA